MGEPTFYYLSSHDQYGCTHHPGGCDRAAAEHRYAGYCEARIADAVRSGEPVPAWRIRLLAYDAASRATAVIGHAGTLGTDARPVAAVDFLSGETLYQCSPIGGRA